MLDRNLGLTQKVIASGQGLMRRWDPPACAVTVDITAIVRVYEDVGAGLQFSIDAARRSKVKDAGAGTVTVGQEIP